MASNATWLETNVANNQSALVTSTETEKDENENETLQNNDSLESYKTATTEYPPAAPQSENDADDEADTTLDSRQVFADGAGADPLPPGPLPNNEDTTRQERWQLFKRRWRDLATCQCFPCIITRLNGSNSPPIPPPAESLITDPIYQEPNPVYDQWRLVRHNSDNPADNNNDTVITKADENRVRAKEIGKQIKSKVTTQVPAKRSRNDASSISTAD